MVPIATLRMSGRGRPTAAPGRGCRSILKGELKSAWEIGKRDRERISRGRLLPRPLIHAAALAVVLFVFGSASSPYAGSSAPGFAAVSSEPRSSAITQRAPIQILDDAGFTSQNGVVGGTGTVADPYVIAGWDINASTSTGILVHYVHAAFVIRDVRVHSGGSDFGGIAVVWNGTTTDPLPTGPVVVENATLEDVDVGLTASYVIGLDLRANRIERTIGPGIWLWGVNGARLEGNAISRQGIPYDSFLYVDRSRDVTVVGNNFWDSLGGINVQESQNVRIYRNNIAQVRSDAGWNAGGNVNLSWDGGPDLGGNYWSGYEGPDLCRGLAQDDCSSPDGIGDVPFSGIGGYGGSDHFPFIGALPGNAVFPTIRQIPVARGTAGSPVILWTQPTFPRGEAIMELWYRGVGGSAFLQATMKRDSNGSYQASIPPQPGPGVVEYYFIAVDALGVRVREPNLGVVAIPIDPNPLVVALLVGGLSAGAVAAVVAVAVLRRRRRVRPGSPPANA